MTLKVTLTLDDTCNLQVTDTTGFYDSVSNPTGFLPDSDTSPVAFGAYKITYGYFLNVLYYNKYNTTPIRLNTSETFVSIIGSVDPTYANNFTPTVYKLTNDGTYTLKRVFIISDTFYNAHVGAGVFTDKSVWYTNGTTITYIDPVDGAIVKTLDDFMSANLTNSTTLLAQSNFIATCYINLCYFKIMSAILDAGLGVCPSEQLATLVKDRDFLYMTLESIKYLKDFNNVTQIQKLIEATDNCCGICSSVKPVTILGTTNIIVNGYLVAPRDCGCHG